MPSTFVARTTATTATTVVALAARTESAPKSRGLPTEADNSHIQQQQQQQLLLILRQQQQQQQQRQRTQEQEQQPQLSHMITMTNKVQSSLSSSSSSSAPAPARHTKQEKLAERELLVAAAQLCEQAARFNDMAEIVNQICSLYHKEGLSAEERNLLSCAYKNVVGSRRASCKILNELLNEILRTQAAPSPAQSASTSAAVSATSATGQNSGIAGLPTNSQHFLSSETRSELTGADSDKSGSHKFNPTFIRSVLKVVEGELAQLCTKIISLLDELLIPSAAVNGEATVFFYKMKGDYMRYLCEIYTGQKRQERANESLLAYKAATEKATIELPPTHPVRLGLMLNFSVFYYDIVKSHERSCRIAKQAFDDAIAELDTLSEESYRESTIIMQLLRDNLNLWQSEQEQQQRQNSQNSQSIAIGPISEVPS